MNRWSGDHSDLIGCRVCQMLIGPDQPGTKLLSPPGLDTDEWRRFVLDTMGLRVPGACRVPQHMCQTCHRKLREAYELFQQAHLTTVLLRSAHEQRERRVALMSRNGDAAASVLPTGRKKRFTSCEEMEGNIKCSEDVDVKPNIDDSQPPTEPSTSLAYSSGSSTMSVSRANVLNWMSASNKTDVNFADNRLQEDNRGFRLLQQQGWQPGDRIGRNSSGIADPIAISVKPDRRGLGNTEDTVYLTHPIMYTFIRHTMLKNGRVQKLIFERDFEERELKTIRGVAGRMGLCAPFNDNGCLHLDMRKRSRR